MEEGLQEGRQEGKEELVVRLIKRRFGAISAQIVDQLNKLSSEPLKVLGETILEFKTPADLEKCISDRFPNVIESSRN